MITFSTAGNEAWRRCPPASPETALAEIRAAISPTEKGKIKNLFAEYARKGEELQKFSQAAIQKSNEKETAALADSNLSPEQTAAVVLEERRFREGAPISEQKVRLQLWEARKKLFPACIKVLEALVSVIDNELAEAPKLGDTMIRWGLSATDELVRAIEHPLLRLRSMASWDLDEIYKPGRAAEEYAGVNFTVERLLSDLA